MNKNNQWVTELTERIWSFLNNLQQDNFVYFPYTLSGDLYTKKDNWGLANTVFATKILYITNLINKLTEDQKKNLESSILKFTQNEGYIYDPLITKHSIKETVKTIYKSGYSKYKKRIDDIQRAETRQSFAALSLLGAKPKDAFKNIPKTEEQVEDFLSSFDWSHPWDAGSHFSHLQFFLYANKLFFDLSDNTKLIQHAVKWVNKLQSAVDGCWYSGEDVSLKQKINGAMKVLTGLHAADIYEINYSEKLIDTCLTAANDEEACSNFNVVYVLYGATRMNSEYRKQEIQEFLQNRLDIYKKFYFENYGGFSFHKNNSNDIYYGKKIAISKNEPDIHGTIMFTWGISIINQMMNLNLNWKVPFN